MRCTLSCFPNLQRSYCDNVHNYILSIATQNITAGAQAQGTKPTFTTSYRHKSSWLLERLRFYVYDTINAAVTCDTFSGINGSGKPTIVCVGLADFDT